MYVARLICSDDCCAEEILAEARTLAELETLACDCGCGLELIGWPDDAGADAGGEPVEGDVVVAFARRPPPADLAA